MGVDYSVFTMVDQEVEEAVLFEKRRDTIFKERSFRTCETHPTEKEAEEQNIKYCPSCGKALFDTKATWVSKFPNLLKEAWVTNFEDTKFGDFYIAIGPEHSAGTLYYIGFKPTKDIDPHQGDCSMEPLNWFPSQDEIDKLASFLKGLGLYSSDALGVWTITYIW